ncbi:hypothetical protein NPIL_444341 [Nephila pilipes]|uniref:Uncharacterized protein n=1 Tax=Nephila pilipes TaxID=299642 RepID=A0A8X6PS80_NEPPI|nr:hypothetical protein NPIL_444341 [Nephila pilipes]
MIQTTVPHRHRDTIVCEQNVDCSPRYLQFNELTLSECAVILHVRLNNLILVLGRPSPFFYYTEPEVLKLVYNSRMLGLDGGSFLNLGLKFVEIVCPICSP